MNTKKRNKLKKNGWRVGSVVEFLDLTPAENSIIELKLTLGHHLKKYREKLHFSQSQVAKILQSSQSRIAKMEKGDPSVSIDLLIKSLFAVGVNKKSLAQIISC